MHLTGRARHRIPPDPKAPASREDVVKELSLEEVLRIAGGVPVTAALDELTYRAPQPTVIEAADPRMLPPGVRDPEPR